MNATCKESPLAFSQPPGPHAAPTRQGSPRSNRFRTTLYRVFVRHLAMRVEEASGRRDRKGNPVRLWRIAVFAGLATALVLLIAAAVGAPHGAPASAVRSTLGAVTAAVSPSQTSAPAPSCPYSGPLGGLNTGETVGVLVVIAIAGIGGGIAIGRATLHGSGGGSGKVTATSERALNPQPLPPGRYASSPGPSGDGAGKAAEPPDPAIHAASPPVPPPCCNGQHLLTGELYPACCNGSHFPQVTSDAVRKAGGGTNPYDKLGPRESDD